jgi:hypothetical protein
VGTTGRGNRQITSHQGQVPRRSHLPKGRLKANSNTQKRIIAFRMLGCQSRVSMDPVETHQSGLWFWGFFEGRELRAFRTDPSLRKPEVINGKWNPVKSG